MKHDELLKEARDYSIGLVPSVQLPGTPTEAFRKASARTLRTLADVVERQDKIITEAVAACVTCDETIRAFTKAYPNAFPHEWSKLCAAAHLASRAAKLGEPKRDIEETLAHASTYHDELLKRLADIGDPTNQAPPKGDDEELAKAKQWLRVAPKLQRALGLAPPTIEEAEAEMAEAEEAPMSDEEIERIATAATNPAPPRKDAKGSKHTKEPWEAIDERFYWLIRSPHHVYGLAQTTCRQMHYNEHAANAKRIVECVNGCADIEDPETTVPELVEAMVELVEDCAADMQQEFGTHENPHPTSPALDRASAVLAKTGKT